MDVDGFLAHLRALPEYRGQIVHVREEPPRAACYADEGLVPPQIQSLSRALGAWPLYSHQAQALAAMRTGQDVLLATGTASGKSLCYVLPILELLRDEPDGRALLLFPTKALCQDQAQRFQRALETAGLDRTLSGVYDGDTPAHTRRSVRDGRRAVFSNPDMLHAALLAQHARWAPFFTNLRYLVLDELHVYNGIFGANVANLLRRLDRVCRHYGSRPQVIACSATLANPLELGTRLTGRPLTLVDQDGSPRGRRVYVFWNPPEIRNTEYRSRRSANVEAHELMAALLQRGVPVITFSKAKMTAELIRRYVADALRSSAPALADKVASYRGGYLPEERREIERRLFSGELLGVSATRALELGIDAGALEAAIIVGYPGTRAGFLQQAGRAGRKEADALVLLVGLDTPANQYLMSHPEYLFERAVEQAVLDPDNPFVITGHLRCAAHEVPLTAPEAEAFGPAAGVALKVLEENGKLRRIVDRYYHAAAEVPQHEVSLRTSGEKTVLIEEITSGQVIGELSLLDAAPILHPGAIYLHHGDTYRCLSLDFEGGRARVVREDVDYYTYPYGGTDVDHIDACLREKPLGSARAYWGEVTVHFLTPAYERVRFYEMDALSIHRLDLPAVYAQTQSLWLVPPEDLLRQAAAAGLDACAGLRGIAYAARMLLPLFITCDTLDLSHSVGSANSPWNALFIYERHPLGAGFTHRAYDRLHEVLPATLEHIRACACERGCPACTGKPLRGYATWNVERAEGNIPAKPAALMLLECILGDGRNLKCPDVQVLSDTPEAQRLRLEQSVRRHLERQREGHLPHALAPQVDRQDPCVETPAELAKPDVVKRIERKQQFERGLHQRLAKKLIPSGLPHGTPSVPPPPGTHKKGATLSPKAFPLPAPDGIKPEIVHGGDALAARAKRLKKQRAEGE